ncbi:DNA repair protein RecO [Alloscardovia venturai]|uniref:DNA repair protein RecO n=1 Tax=Alloscardovia venturai TaxID=1769421 RepID=A0ABW2Y609_9BIFI
MPSYTDAGVVLRTVKLGEADRIITILTKQHGKVRAVAKGVRRTKSRFGGRLEPFNRNQFLLFEGRGQLQHINQAETLNAYGASLITNYDAYVAANVIGEAVDKLLDSMGDEGVQFETHDASLYYDLLVSALHALVSEEHEPQVIESSFILRMLSMSGWSPRLDTCVVCGRQTQLDFFSISAGGMMCRSDRLPDAYEISHDVRTQLYALLHGRWDILDSAKNTQGSSVLFPRTVQIVEEWLQYYVERPVRSLKLVKSNT